MMKLPTIPPPSGRLADQGQMLGFDFMKTRGLFGQASKGYAMSLCIHFTLH